MKRTIRLPLFILSAVLTTCPDAFSQDMSNIPRGKVGLSPNSVSPNGPVPPPPFRTWRPEKDRTGQFKRPRLSSPGRRGGGGNVSVSPNGVSPNGPGPIPPDPNSPGIIPNSHEDWRLGFVPLYPGHHCDNKKAVVVSNLANANGVSPLSKVYLPPGNYPTGRLDKGDVILGINQSRVNMANFKDVLKYYAERNNGWVYIHVWSAPDGSFAFEGEGLWVKAEKVRI